MSHTSATRWLTFLVVRFPISVYFPIAAGLTLSGLFLTEDVPTTSAFFASLLGTLLFFLEYRIMDDVKDFPVDSLAYPTRPLPRQLLSPKEARKGVRFLLIAMIFYGFLLSSWINSIAGGCYLFATLYLWLIYQEFYVPSWRSARRVLQTFVHQIVLFPLVGFHIAVIAPHSVPSTTSLMWTLTVIGSFGALELCRKLNPEEHPALQTYIHRYGPARLAFFLIFSLLLSAWGSYALGIYKILWPVQGAVLVGFLWHTSQPRFYKYIEALAGLSLMLHLWSVILFEALF